MKIHLLALIASLGLAASSSAITIQTGIGFNPGVVTQDALTGTVITSSYQFAIGVFSAEPAAGTTFAAALLSFTEFTRATVAANAAGGKIVAPGAGAIAAVSTAGTRATFDTKEAYVFVGNGLTLEASTQYAIIKGTPTWLFPADTTGAASMNVIVSSATAFSTVIGTEVDNATGADALRLFVVPEPSASLMAVFAACGLIARRRR